ncbi:hypothetical protein ARMGADRAFT_1169301 [Armillaria gallica]|uniref:Uncharacterized protein n=1 Tax=Armillaria gallica TaxID=47427 RepID=A0A2H3DAS1_ARMGA|nr:hypothetical protein ARMGADRAFT_1169301 [Armillaria gallica]
MSQNGKGERNLALIVETLNITGDVIAFIDDGSKMLNYNWKIDQGAYLDGTSDSQHDHYIQVVFTLTTILVVPARYITVYTVPLA